MRSVSYLQGNVCSSSGVASIEQMEQLLSRAAQDHLRNSCKSDELFWSWELGLNKRGICNAT